MSYKILSLDGGISRALIQAHIFQNIYGIIKARELLREFEQVIANAGGSLVLACLRNEMQFSEIMSVLNVKQNGGFFCSIERKCIWLFDRQEILIG